MVNRPLSSRDLELLSAYLDRQLNSVEQRRLEERMRLNPGLQNAFDELRRTRAMLRSLPKVRAPRNFTLTPAMLPARRRQMLWGLPLNWNFASALRSLLKVRTPRNSTLAPAVVQARRQQLMWGLPLNWSLASAMATLFLLVFFAGDFLGLFSPRSAILTAQRPSEAQALETAMVQIDQQSKASAEDSQAPELAMPLAPENARGMGGGGGDGSEATLQAVPMILGTPQPYADQMLVLTTPTPEPAAQALPVVEVTATNTTTSTLSAKSAPATELAFVPPTEQAEAPAGSQPAITPTTEVLFTPLWVRLIETALLLIALGAGVYAFARRAR